MRAWRTVVWMHLITEPRWRKRLADDSLDCAEIKRVKDETEATVRGILAKMGRDYPGFMEGAGATVGAASGGAASLFALTSLGTAGLSGAGITSGLATAGAVVGGGMVAGIGVLAAPVAGLALGGYWLAGKRRKAKLAASIHKAVSQLDAIQRRLMANAEFFRDEIAQIRAMIGMLNARDTKAPGGSSVLALAYVENGDEPDAAG